MHPKLLAELYADVWRRYKFNLSYGLVLCMVTLNSVIAYLSCSIQYFKHSSFSIYTFSTRVDLLYKMKSERFVKNKSMQYILNYNINLIKLLCCFWYFMDIWNLELHTMYFVCSVCCIVYKKAKWSLERKKRFSCCVEDPLAVWGWSGFCHFDTFHISILNFISTKRHDGMLTQ